MAKWRVFLHSEAKWGLKWVLLKSGGMALPSFLTVRPTCLALNILLQFFFQDYKQVQLLKITATTVAFVVTGLFARMIQLAICYHAVILANNQLFKGQQ